MKKFVKKDYGFAIAIFSNGKVKTSRAFTQEEAGEYFFEWADKQCEKDENVIIDEYDVNNKTGKVTKVHRWCFDH